MITPISDGIEPAQLNALFQRLQASGPVATVDNTPWRIWCLCAQWCGVCREFELILNDPSATYNAIPRQWIDVEDEAELIDDLDIETFPTLLISHGDELKFFGPLLPQKATLERLLRGLGVDS